MWQTTKRPVRSRQPDGFGSAASASHGTASQCGHLERQLQLQLGKAESFTTYCSMALLQVTYRYIRKSQGTQVCFQARW